MFCAGAVVPVIGAAVGASPVLAAVLAAIGSVSSGAFTNVISRTIDRLRDDDGAEVSDDDLEAALAAALDDVVSQVGEEAAEVRRGMAVLLAETGAVTAALESVIRDSDEQLLERLQGEFERLDAFDEFVGVFAEVRDVVIENLRVSRESAAGQVRLERSLAADVTERRRFEQESLESSRRITQMLHTLLGRINRGDDGARRTGGFERTSPYRGLYPFREDDAEVFFGRDDQTFKVLEYASASLDANGMMALTAASGAGKTSLLRAGVFTAIAEGWWIDQPGSESWPLVYLTPGIDPLGALATELATRIDGALTPDVRRVLREEPHRANLLAKQALQRSDSDGSARMVMVVDQFEELFTLTDDESERQAFITALASISQGPSREGDSTSKRSAHRGGCGLVVLGVRSDFLDQCAEHVELLPAVERHLHFLAPMDADQMRQAITGPAFATGLAFEEGLAEVILDDLRGSATGAEFSPAALPLLSQAMRKLWEGRKNGCLTKTAYGQVGGVSRALQASADEVYEALSPSQREAAELLFRRLAKVTRDKQLVRVPLRLSALKELGPEGNDVVEAFTAARLLVVGEATVEIAHDALLRHWPKVREWLESDSDSLAVLTALIEDAEEWEASGRDQSFLYRGGRLELAEDECKQRWAEHPDRFAPLDVTTLEFLGASRRREARAKRIRRAVTSTLASLLALALIAFGLVLVANRELTDERNRALSVQLAAESAKLHNVDGQLAQLLAAAAWQLSETDEAFVAMTSAADDASIGGLTSDLVSSVQALRFSPDGSSLFAREGSGSYTLWSTETWEPYALNGSAGGGFADTEFSPDGKVIAANIAEGTRIWDAENGDHKMTLEPWDVFDIAISADSSMIATAEGLVTRIWDLESGELLTELEGEASAEAVVFSADGESLFTGDDSGVYQWDLGTGSVVASEPIGEHLTALWASPSDPERVIACANTGCLSRGSDGAWTTFLSTPAWQAAVSPDEDRIATWDQEGSVSVWDLSSSELLALLPATDVIDMAFQPGGSILAAGTEKGIQLWDLDRVRSTSQDLLQSDLTSAGHQLGYVSASQSDRLLGTGWDGAYVWDLHGDPSVEAALVGQYPDRAGGVSALSPDGTLAATAPWGERLEEVDIWDPETGEVLMTLGGHDRTVEELVFSSDGRVLVTAEGQASDLDSPDYGLVRFWSMDTGEEIKTIDMHEGGVAAVAFSPDGRTLATADAFGVVRLWDLQAQDTWGAAMTARLLGNGSYVSELAFTSDGAELAAATDSGLSIWDIDSEAHRNLAAELLGGSDAQLSLSLSPDDQYALISDGEGLHIWDITRDMEAAKTFETLSSVATSGFISDGWSLVAASYSGVWIADIGYLADPYAAVCEETGRDLTDKEWETYLPGVDRDELSVCGRQV
ncbi:WD40 repeat domain-containing protein [Glycomyces sp. NPDC048151]|uniref:WD40 repeat domain-containing protein n=1 Tax=Glycomyces sp. NPDC048151 TaxID=3364002 RepID=UPI003710C75E